MRRISKRVPPFIVSSRGAMWMGTLSRRFQSTGEEMDVDIIGLMGRDVATGAAIKKGIDTFELLADEAEDEASTSRGLTEAMGTVAVSPLGAEEVGYKQRVKLEQLDNDTLMKRIGGFSKLQVPASQLPMVKAMLEEVLDNRTGSIPLKGYRDVLHLAYVSKQYELCLSLFNKRAETHEDADPMFTVYDIVVDSAFLSSNISELKNLGAICTRKLEFYTKEVIADFSLCRIFWRLLCLSRDKNLSKAQREEALRGAQAVFVTNICKAVPGVEGRLTLDDIVAETRRHIVYAADDLGEMGFFLMCHQKKVLRASSRDPLVNMSPRECETFYCALIRTCRGGRFADQALDYLAELRGLIRSRAERHEQLKTLTGTPSPDTSVVVDDEPKVAFKKRANKPKFELLSPEEEDGDAGSGAEYADALQASEEANGVTHKSGHPLFSSRVGGMTEIVLFSVLAVLNNAQDHAKTVAFGRTLVDEPDAVLSPSIWGTLGVAAGETKDLPFAIQAFEQVCNGGVATPTPFLVYSCLSAISKCHTPRFEEDYLKPVIQRGLVSEDPETYSYLVLQNGLTSANPMKEARRVLEDMRDKGTSLSVRVASLCFKILLRAESEEFLTFYKRVVDTFGLFKRVWVEELILWADRRRYFITTDERQYIMDEARRHFGVTDVRSEDLGGLEKLRTHLATIYHDLSHSPLDGFKESGWISPDPIVMDSRVHFLMKKKTCVDTDPEGTLSVLVTNNRGVMRERGNKLRAAVEEAASNPGVIGANEHKYFLLELVDRSAHRVAPLQTH